MVPFVVLFYIFIILWFMEYIKLLLAGNKNPAKKMIKIQPVWNFENHTGFRPCRQPVRYLYAVINFRKAKKINVQVFLHIQARIRTL